MLLLVQIGVLPSAELKPLPGLWRLTRLDSCALPHTDPVSHVTTVKTGRAGQQVQFHRWPNLTCPFTKICVVLRIRTRQQQRAAVEINPASLGSGPTRTANRPRTIGSHGEGTHPPRRGRREASDRHSFCERRGKHGWDFQTLLRNSHGKGNAETHVWHSSHDRARPGHLVDRRQNSVCFGWRRF